MSETMALVRLALQQQRLILMVIGSLVVIGVTSSFLLAASGIPDDQDFGIAALVVTMIPAIALTFAMFTFGSDRDLLLGESGYLHWILRLPIADWKLALVPVTLKTIWTSSLWIIFALTLRATTEANPYLIGPAIGFSTVGIWLLVLMWRPFTNGWWRLASFIVCGLVLYALVVGVLIELEKDDPTSARWLEPVVTAGTYGMFALGIWMSIRAVQLARTNALGLIPETGRTRTNVSASTNGYGVRHDSSPSFALVWHDLQKSRELIRWFTVLGVIPAIILFTVFMPFSLVGYVGVMIVFTFFGFGASSSVLERTNKGMTFLPPYLGASPLSTATIAWVRMFTIAAILVTALSLTLLVFAGWTLSPENRETWNQWAGEMAAATGSPSAGLRIAAATVLATCLVVVGRGIAYIWPALCGLQWIQFAAAVVSSLMYFIPVYVTMAWFLQQTSWESTQESALHWLSYLPAIAITWLTVKALGVGITVAQLRSRRLVSSRAIGVIIGGWLLVTSANACAVHALIPYPQATLLWCFTAAAICSPIVRVLLLPVSLHFGRHQ